MCVVSMIGDHFQEKWTQPNYEWIKYYINDPNTPVSKLEFEALKKEVEEMKQLLIKAKKYDEKNNEPNCEMENKVKFLKLVAEAMGVDLKNIFK